MKGRFKLWMRYGEEDRDIDRYPVDIRISNHGDIRDLPMESKPTLVKDLEDLPEFETRQTRESISYAYSANQSHPLPPATKARNKEQHRESL